MATKFDKVRDGLMETISTLLVEKGEEILRTGSQELCLPIVGEENEEGFLVLTFKIPKGSRDGEPYDGYAMAEEYKMKCAEKAEKARIAAEKKVEKMKKDAEMRKARAEAKAKRAAEA